MRQTQIKLGEWYMVLAPVVHAKRGSKTVPAKVMAGGRMQNVWGWRWIVNYHDPELADGVAMAVVTSGMIKWHISKENLEK